MYVRQFTVVRKVWTFESGRLNFVNRCFTKLRSGTYLGKIHSLPRVLDLGNTKMKSCGGEQTLQVSLKPEKGLENRN